MQDPDITFDQTKALRLVCKSLDAVCSQRVLISIRLFGSDAKDVSGNFRHLKSVLSCNRLLSASTLVIPNWQWIHGDEIFMTFRDSPGPGGAATVILVNAFVMPFLAFLLCIVAPKTLPLGVFHSSIRLRAKTLLAFRNEEIGISNIRRVE
jgi:hypothetical protein